MDIILNNLRAPLMVRLAEGCNMLFIGSRECVYKMLFTTSRLLFCQIQYNALR